MTYVYLLQSESDRSQRYIGMTEDLKQRFSDHNNGQSKHTAKHKPWRIVTYLAFENRTKAIAMEKYLKSGSGRAFANKHFWSL